MPMKQPVMLHPGDVASEWRRRTGLARQFVYAAVVAHEKASRTGASWHELFDDGAEIWAEDPEDLLIEAMSTLQDVGDEIAEGLDAWITQNWNPSYLENMAGRLRWDRAQSAADEEGPDATS